MLRPSTGQRREIGFRCAKETASGRCRSMASFSATTTRRNMPLRLPRCTRCPAGDRRRPPDSPAGLRDPGGRERRLAFAAEFRGLSARDRAHRTADRNAHAAAIEDTGGDRWTRVRRKRDDENNRSSMMHPLARLFVGLAVVADVAASLVFPGLAQDGTGPTRRRMPRRAAKAPPGLVREASQ